jgi:hypothetical protein
MIHCYKQGIALDHTIQRILRLFTEQNDFPPVWNQQFDLWEKLDLSSFQRQAIMGDYSKPGVDKSLYL